MTVFLASDNARALDIGKKLLEDLNGKGLTLRVTDGSALGNVGHVTLSRSDNILLRVHTEWEIIRHSDFLFLSRSGYSLVPFALRHSPNTRAFSTLLNSAGRCEELAPTGLAWFFEYANTHQFKN